MAVDNTPDVKKPEEGATKTPKVEVASLVDETRMNLLLSSVKEEVCKDSRIDSSRTFSEKEIIDVILGTFTEAQKLRLNALKISRIIRDEKNTVVAMEARLPDADGKGGYVEIKYILQGKHGRNQSQLSLVAHSFHNSNSLAEKRSGDNAAEFKDGKWVYIPVES